MDSILNDRTGKNDLLTKAMEELGKAFPTLQKVIINERDLFMVAKLRQVADMMMSMEGDDDGSEKVIVAVVGAGHCPGMLKQLICENTVKAEHAQPIEVLPSLVETKKMKISNNEEVYSLVTDVVQFDYTYALENEAL